MKNSKKKVIGNIIIYAEKVNDSKKLIKMKWNCSKILDARQ